MSGHTERVAHDQHSPISIPSTGRLCSSATVTTFRREHLLDRVCSSAELGWRSMTASRSKPNLHREPHQHERHRWSDGEASTPQDQKPFC